MRRFPKNKGFTLIELLVVISIIGLLSSVVLASLNSARGKARDTKIKANLKQLQTALQLYYSDNGQYPAGGCDTSAWSNSVNCPTTYVTGLAGTYIPALPTAVKSGDYYTYSSRSGDNYQSYKLTAGNSESETILPTSAWAHCAQSCATTNPSSWCGQKVGTLGVTSWTNRYSINSGPDTYAYCGY